MLSFKSLDSIKKIPTPTKLVHLLYAPTLFCNLGCHYCYLGNQIDQHQIEDTKTLSTLNFAVEKFLSAGALPFNISLHGGEVTTIKPNVLEQLFQFILDYYHDQSHQLKKYGFYKKHPHIKTNLFNFDKLYDLFNEYNVSISASIDLPLRMHEKYRTTKNNKSTLKQTLQNLQLLATYPHNQKISSTLYREHLDATDEIIRDIKYLQNEVGFDMNKLNFMFGFGSELNQKRSVEKEFDLLTPATEQQMVNFYQRLKNEFSKSNLSEGFRKNWFDEFTPSYCTNALNCGEKFYLIQSDGKIYSCVRGQGSQPFYYGNIYTDTIKEIMQNGERSIASIHQSHSFHPDCQSCNYLHHCHTGCAFVKSQNASGKSYTCHLQKEIYKDNPILYPKIENEKRQAYIKRSYEINIHPKSAFANNEKDLEYMSEQFILPNDLHDSKNQLLKIIQDDPILTILYASDNFILESDGESENLESQILKKERKIYNLDSSSKLFLFIKKDIFSANCNEYIKNNLHIQMLRDTKVIYGEEKREKQEHIMNLQIYSNFLQNDSALHYKFDLMPFIGLNRKNFISNTLNNLFFTTHYLREYHYQKQKNNAFYHIQAINLPFQNFEFFWNDGDKHV